jgi:hypothetical protein
MSRRLLLIDSAKRPNPIFGVDCNYNNIDKISGLPAVTPAEVPNLRTKYVLDPINSNRYCAMRVPGGGGGTSTTYYTFAVTLLRLPCLSHVGNPYVLTQNNNLDFVGLDNLNGNGNGCRLEFMVYFANDNTNRFILSDGDLYLNWWQTNGGISLCLYNGNLVIFARNNSTHNIIRLLRPQSNLVNKWITFQYDITEVSPTQFSAVIKVLDNGKLITSEQFRHTKPMDTDRALTFFSSNWGWRLSFENTVDMLKEVKIFKQSSLSDFSIYT